MYYTAQNTSILVVFFHCLNFHYNAVTSHRTPVRPQDKQLARTLYTHTHSFCSSNSGSVVLSPTILTSHFSLIRTKCQKQLSQLTKHHYSNTTTTIPKKKKKTHKESWQVKAHVKLLVKHINLQINSYFSLSCCIHNGGDVTVSTVSL